METIEIIEDIAKQLFEICGWEVIEEEEL